jgi:hypothetical protein
MVANEELERLRSCVRRSRPFARRRHGAADGAAAGLGINAVRSVAAKQAIACGKGDGFAAVRRSVPLQPYGGRRGGWAWNQRCAIRGGQNIHRLRQRRRIRGGKEECPSSASAAVRRSVPLQPLAAVRRSVRLQPFSWRGEPHSRLELRHW